ncbi:NAD-dependent epimerase/dehydratase family protein [Vibrio lentus]|uniref:NAD-dependent epimerase/dehydratase family protein n=1 Tax=Vibrio lentus TaxID=136468 RepID=UPI00178CEA39|nr:NAD(P)-dependent oxidoreductase [Vibrio lentus]MDN3632434.1 NAD(P)-dependent oxidoreductase [Vibrio lentus]
MSKVVITGANGFLGRNLVQNFLNLGDEVVSIVRVNGSREHLVNLNTQIIEYDGTIASLECCLDEESIVIHTAAYYVAEHQIKDLPILIQSNLEYGLNLLEAMRITGAHKIINIGTAWQGYKGDKRRAVNLYAATKQAFEDFIAYYCDAEGFSSISLRLNDTYGEEDERMKLVKLLINAGVTKTALNMSAGDQKVNLTHISDVCAAILVSVSNLPSANKLDVYNLINQDEYSLKELVKIIEDELNMTIPVNFGVREYRSREVMEPIKSNNFNFYSPVVTLRSGIKKIYNQSNDK